MFIKCVTENSGEYVFHVFLNPETVSQKGTTKTLQTFYNSFNKIAENIFIPIVLALLFLLPTRIRLRFLGSFHYFSLFLRTSQAFSIHGFVRSAVNPVLLHFSM